MFACIQPVVNEIKAAGLLIMHKISAHVALGKVSVDPSNFE